MPIHKCLVLAVPLLHPVRFTAGPSAVVATYLSSVFGTDQICEKAERKQDAVEDAPQLRPPMCAADMERLLNHRSQLHPTTSSLRVLMQPAILSLSD